MSRGIWLKPASVSPSGRTGGWKSASSSRRPVAAGGGSQLITATNYELIQKLTINYIIIVDNE